MIWLALLGCPAHRYPDGTDLTGQLEREVVALTQRNRELERDLAACGAGRATGAPAPDRLAVQLGQVFSGSEVAVDAVGPHVRLVARASLLFADPWSLALRAEAGPALDLVATAIGLNPDRAVYVVGHTSDRPLPRNWQRAHGDLLGLSSHEAEAVARALVRSHQVDVGRLAIAGRGPYTPETSNDTPAGQAANQRVEIWLLAPDPALAGEGAAPASVPPPVPVP